MPTQILRAIVRCAILPVLIVASLPFGLASCALLETLRPSITAAGHILLNGLDDLLTQLENASPAAAATDELTQQLIESFEICAETVPKRYLEPYRLRFRAAVRQGLVSEGDTTAPPI